MEKTKTHRIKKPKLCFYSDYTIQNGKCYAIFETMDGRVHTQFVCRTQKTNADWKSFTIEETKMFLKINLN